MFKFYKSFVLFLPFVVAYPYHHGYHLTSSDNHGVSQSSDKYFNFDNFDESRRSGRQVRQFNFLNNPTNGFNWDSPSEQNDFDSGRNRPRFPNRPSINQFRGNSRESSENDGFIFDDQFEDRNFFITTTTPRTRTSTVAIPGMGTTRTPCEDRCLTTPQYNPACGDDDMTYFSIYRLKCAQKCGKRVTLKHMGACSIIPPRG